MSEDVSENFDLIHYRLAILPPFHYRHLYAVKMIVPQKGCWVNGIIFCYQNFQKTQVFIIQKRFNDRSKIFGQQPFKVG